MDGMTNSITQDEIILKLMELLKQNQMKDKANDIFEAANHIDGLQNKLDKVMGELITVKQQLADIQEQNERKSIKEVLTKAVTKMEECCSEMKQQLFEIKEDFKNKAKQVVDNVKQKGRETLNHMSEFLGVKEKLAKMRSNVKDSIADVDKMIGKIDTFGKGMREANQQLANIFRTVADKETVDYAEQEKQFSKTEAVKKPWQVKKRLLEGMELRLDAAIDKVDNLAKDVEMSKMQDNDVSLDEAGLSGGEEPATIGVADNSYEYGSDAFEAYQKQNMSEKVDISKVVESVERSR